MLSELRSTKGLNLRLKPKPMLCQEHNNLELMFYCETCEQLVCHYCTITEHTEHEHNTIKKVAHKHRQQLDEFMVSVEKITEELSKVFHKVTTAQEEVKRRATEVDQHIDACYETLLQHLQQQRDTLKEAVNKVSTDKSEALLKQLDQIKFVQAQYEKVNVLYRAVKDRSNQEALFAKKQVINDVGRITNGCYKRLDTEPVEAATIEFVPFIKLKSEGLLGQVYVSGFKISGAPSYAFVGRKVEFDIVSKNKKYLKNKCKAEIRVRVTSIATGGIIKVQVVNYKDGCHSVSFICDAIGEVSVIASAGEREDVIEGSPHSIMVHNDYKSLELPSKVINNSSKMGIPWGIAFGIDGIWAVAVYDHDCIHVFDSQDRPLRTFGCTGSGDGQFNWPYGLAFDANNYLYVSDYNNNRIQKFTAAGKYVRQFGGFGVGKGKLQEPLGVLIHSNEVFIADQKNHRISIFNLDGQFSRTIGSFNQLEKPHHMAVSADNHLYIANFKHDSISIYKLDDGQYVGNFGTSGSGIGQLSTPTCLVIDKYGFILVTEYVNGRVSVFDSDHKLVHCFGSIGSGLGQFKRPRGIAISPTGNVYITDYKNKRVQIFSSF